MSDTHTCEVARGIGTTVGCRMTIACISSSTHYRKEIALTGIVTDSTGISPCVLMANDTIARIGIPLCFCKVITLHRANDTIATLILTDYRHILDITNITISNATYRISRR